MKRVGIFRIHFASCCEVLAQHRESFQDAHYLPNFLCKKQARSPWWPWLVCKSSSLRLWKDDVFFLQFFAPTSRRLHILYIPPGKYDGMYCIFKVLGYQWGHNLSQPHISTLISWGSSVHQFSAGDVSLPATSEGSPVAVGAWNIASGYHCPNGLGHVWIGSPLLVVGWYPLSTLPYIGGSSPVLVNLMRYLDYSISPQWCVISVFPAASTAPCF